MLWQTANKLRDIYIQTLKEVRRGTSPSRSGKFTISKSKSPRLSYIFIETDSLLIDEFKPQNAASVSEIYSVNHLFEVNIIDIEEIIQISRS